MEEPIGILRTTQTDDSAMEYTGLNTRTKEGHSNQEGEEQPLGPLSCASLRGQTFVEIFVADDDALHY
jgi:hypothetical protein